MLGDRRQREARRVLTRDARELVMRFGHGFRCRLASRVRKALDACPDYQAALDRHRAHRRCDVPAPPPLLRQIDRLIADLEGDA